MAKAFILALRYFSSIVVFVVFISRCKMMQILKKKRMCEHLTVHLAS